MKRLSYVLLLLPALAAAQVSDVRPVPNCIVQFTASAVGVGGTFDNRAGCAYWTINYSSIGFSALTLAVESAPGANVAGTWVTFAGTVGTGSNPNTAITQASTTISGFYPWMRVNLTAATGTGTIRAQLYGYKQNPNGSTTATISGNVAVVGPDANGAVSTTAPVQIAGNDGTDVRRVRLDTAGLTPVGTSAAMVDGTGNVATLFTTPTGTNGSAYPGAFPFKFNGSTWDRDFACTNQAAIVLTASGNTQIIAASGSTTIRICHFSLASDTVQNIKITRGTGTNCGTGTADITGLYYGVTALAFDFTPAAAFRGAASGAICINQSVTGNAGGVVIYAQY